MIETRNSGRLVNTAAHCLTNMPEPHLGAARIVLSDCLHRLGEKPRIIAACLFADQVTEIAVVGRKVMKA
jgi:hypothetical protein